MDRLESRTAWLNSTDYYKKERIRNKTSVVMIRRMRHAKRIRE